MKKITTTLVFILLLININTKAQQYFNAGKLKIGINDKGSIVSLINTIDNKEYIYKDTIAPLISIKTAKGIEHPGTMVFNKKDSTIVLDYPHNKIGLLLKLSVKKTHLVIELINVDKPKLIEAVIWGPYPTTISKIVGEIIGVVRNDNFALGIQVLNVKTLGGKLLNNEGSDQSRSSTADKQSWGSTIQAYSLNRDRKRNVDVWGDNFPNAPVEPMPGENVMGSKIALFGCAEKDALNTIGEIEIAEGLPHPLINGVWMKVSPETGRSYIISNFNENNVDEMLAYTKRAGLMTLYHEGPFQNWGHYDFDTVYTFMHNIEGVKTCVKKADKLGIRLGAHTLSDFITTDDKYVTPIPDERLAITGFSNLATNISDKDSTITVLSPEYFNNEKHNDLHTVKIGKELIRYRTVTATAPYQLLNCQRGAFGTSVSSHKKGDKVAKLMDHGYKVFFPNIDLGKEIARNMAKIFNETGLGQMDFDGCEGSLSCGQGDYGVEVFAKEFYDHLDHTVLNGPSNSEPFYWHMNTYCNWGEPWYGGFNESMQQYRIDNQGLFDRNYLPHMLGWYLLTSNTTLTEMEWMLARAAGYDAGFAMVVRYNDAKKNPNTDILLDAINNWESARRSHAFIDNQKERLKNPKNEFHLEKIADKSWNLYQNHVSEPYVHEKIIKQPGEPVNSSWTFTNNDDEQPLSFRIIAEKGKGVVKDIIIVIDSYYELKIPTVLKAGEKIVTDGSDKLLVFDAKGKLINTFTVAKFPSLIKGQHTITFDCKYEDEDAPKLTVYFVTKGIAEPVNMQ